MEKDRVPTQIQSATDSCTPNSRDGCQQLTAILEKVHVHQPTLHRQTPGYEQDPRAKHA